MLLATTCASRRRDKTKMHAKSKNQACADHSLSCIKNCHAPKRLLFHRANLIYFLVYTEVEETLDLMQFTDDL